MSKEIKVLEALIETKREKVEKIQNEATKLENVASKMRFEILELNGELNHLESIHKTMVGKTQSKTKAKRGPKTKAVKETKAKSKRGRPSKKIVAVESQNETEIKKAS